MKNLVSSVCSIELTFNLALPWSWKTILDLAWEFLIFVAFETAASFERVPPRLPLP